MRELSAELRDLFAEAKKVEERLEGKPGSKEDFDFMVNYKSQCLQEAEKLISEEEARISEELRKVDAVSARLEAAGQQASAQDRLSADSRRKKLSDERGKLEAWKAKAKELEEEIGRLRRDKQWTVFKKKFTQGMPFKVFAAITAISGGFLLVFIAAHFMQLAEPLGIVQYFQQFTAGLGLSEMISIYTLALVACALLLPLAVFVFFEKVHKT